MFLCGAFFISPFERAKVAIISLRSMVKKGNGLTPFVAQKNKKPYIPRVSNDQHGTLPLSAYLSADAVGGRTPRSISVGQSRAPRIAVVHSCVISTYVAKK